MIRDEMLASIDYMGQERFVEQLFSGFQADEEIKESLIASLCSGHNILIVL